MAKKLLITIITVLIVGAFFALDRVRSFNPSYEKIANQITLDTGHSLKEKYDLYTIGIGGGMIDDIKHMDISLRSISIPSIDEARELILSCIDIYLDRINSTEEVRNYLHCYPFKEDNISVRIFFGGKNENKFEVGSLSVVSNYDGKIHFRAVKNDTQSETVLVETYGEARGIVEAERELRSGGD